MSLVLPPSDGSACLGLKEAGMGSRLLTLTKHPAPVPAAAGMQEGGYRRGVSVLLPMAADLGLTRLLHLGGKIEGDKWQMLPTQIGFTLLVCPWVIYEYSPASPSSPSKTCSPGQDLGSKALVKELR